MLEMTINSVEESLFFGGKMAQAIMTMQRNSENLPKAFYMYGDLGAGKTTLTRGIVTALPRGHAAEVASPSFTLCHEYPTEPEIFHGDLYRLPNACQMPEEFMECPETTVIILEWAERLQAKAMHRDRVDMHFSVKNTEFCQEDSGEELDNFDNSCDKKCVICLTAHGEIASKYIQCLHSLV